MTYIKILITILLIIPAISNARIENNIEHQKSLSEHLKPWSDLSDEVSKWAIGMDSINLAPEDKKRVMDVFIKSREMLMLLPSMFPTLAYANCSVNPEFFDLTKTYYKAISDAPNMNYSKAINDKTYLRDFTAKRDLYWEKFVLPLKIQVLEQIISGDIFLDPVCEKN